MLCLDCTDHGTALDSVSGILGIEVAELSRILKTVSPMEGTLDRRKDLVERVVEMGGDLQADEFAVCWFHATRIPSDADFSKEGLLPTADFYTQLLGQLEAIFDREQFPGTWEEIKKGRAFLPASADDHGPHGWLTKEYLMQPGAAGRKYLAIPEVLENFCRATNHAATSQWLESVGGAQSPEDYSGEAQSNAVAQKLGDFYMAERQPALVKFRSTDGSFSREALGAAVWYLHCKAHKRPLDQKSTQGYSANGVAVPPSELWPIEWL